MDRSPSPTLLRSTTECASESTATASTTLLSLDQDVWPECLKFLSPRDMASTSMICKSLLFSQPLSGDNNYNEQKIMERGSWLALESAVQKAVRIVRTSNWVGAAIGQKDGAVGYAVYRYPGENWMELYALFWSLISLAEDLWTTYYKNSAESDDDDDDDEEEDKDNEEKEEQSEIINARKNNTWVTTCWLLFGWPEGSRLPPQALSPCTKIGYQNCKELLGHLLLQKASQHQQRHRTRILQSALRLSDAGDWVTASNLLTLILVNANDSSGGGGGGQTGERQQQEEELQENNAEIKICVCTFLIDRLYANTYVRVNDNDSQDLSRAVNFGREAMAFCLSQSREEQHQPTNDDNITSHIDPRNSKDEVDSSGCYRRQQIIPPSPVSLFPSDSMRLAAACLATGKALALLAQHLGLRATYIEDIAVRPIEEEEVLASENDNETRRQPADVLFFQEGEAILQASIKRLEEEEEEEERMASDRGDGFSEKIELLEVKAATYAALGELYYCSASVASIFFGARRSQLTQKAINYLTLSLQMVQRKLLILVERRTTGTPPTVELLCSTAPRSLMILQARTSKDLGKVCQFAGSQPLLFKAKTVLEFALAVSSRLHFEGHPFILNVKRLERGGNFTDFGSEDNVNQWLSQDPLFENV